MAAEYARTELGPGCGVIHEPQHPRCAYSGGRDIVATLHARERFPLRSALDGEDDEARPGDRGICERETRERMLVVAVRNDEAIRSVEGRRCLGKKRRGVPIGTQTK